MGVEHMGKVEALGLVVAMAGALGTRAVEAPPEARQIAMADKLVAMSRVEFESWCRDKGAQSDASLGASDDTKATCAWVESATGSVWHTALHFDGRSPMPRQADSGLLHASNETVRRLVHNDHGVTDGESAEGFPVWQVDVGGRDGWLAIAEYDEITLVQIRVAPEGAAVSMR